MALNPRQEKFCQLYHETGNATQSYLEAYGCSLAASRQNAYRLLTKEGIKDRLDELTGETRQLCAMSRAELLDYATRVVATPVGEVDETSDLCEEVTHSEFGTKIKMFSKAAAFEKIVKMCGYNEPDKVEVSAEDDLVEMLRGITGAREK